VELPAPSTIGDLLKRQGLIHPRRRRIRPLDGGFCRPSEIRRPNEEWRADFKGEFKLGNGEYCYPLTITDGASRYLLETRALDSTAGPACAGASNEPLSYTDCLGPSGRITGRPSPARRSAGFPHSRYGGSGWGSARCGGGPATRKTTAATSGCTGR
jgi:transposase InsO family protein